MPRCFPARASTSFSTTCTCASFCSQAFAAHRVTYLQPYQIKDPSVSPSAWRKCGILDCVWPTGVTILCFRNLPETVLGPTTDDEQCSCSRRDRSLLLQLSTHARASAVVITATSLWSACSWHCFRFFRRHFLLSHFGYIPFSPEHSRTRLLHKPPTFLQRARR